jgi:hypothetical protein
MVVYDWLVLYTEEPGDIWNLEQFTVTAKSKTEAYKLALNSLPETDIVDIQLLNINYKYKLH